MRLIRILARIPSTTFLGKFVRRVFRLVPRRSVEEIRSGPLRGRKWIVASGVDGYWLGTYEEELLDTVARSVRAGGVFFDVGAQAGYYSLLASRLVGPTGRVVAFEPDARNLGYLREHLRLNDATNVTVIEAAVADAAGSEGFAAERSGFGGALSETAAASGGTVTVRTVTLDGLVGSGAVPAPDYLKIDVEGAELRVLRGAAKILRASRPTIFLAVHTPDLERLCRETLTTLGYTLQPITDGAWLCVASPA